MNDPKNGQVEWSAFCYVAGEMTESEREQFEQLLASDQSARELLAQAVELTQAMAAAEAGCHRAVAVVAPASRVETPKAWPRRLAWMAIGSAASLLVALIWNSSGAGIYVASLWEEPEVELPMKSGELSSLPQLAAAWTQTRTELSDANDAALWYPAHLAASGWSESGADSSFDERTDPAAEDAFHAPSWMTAAVSGLAAKAEPAVSDRPSNEEQNENSDGDRDDNASVGPTAPAEPVRLDQAAAQGEI